MAKRILVTGVSRGLGRAMTEGFIERGHTVCGCARNADAVAELSARWGAPHAFHVVDVTRDDLVQDWARQLGADDEPFDLLINNAALVNRNAPLWLVSAEEMAELLAVNVAGVVNVIRHFAPPMIARGRGVIVNFSSAWGRTTSAEVGPYCATKFAVEGLTLALAQELPSGMAAVPLNPGIIDTDMLRSCFGSQAADYPGPAEWARRAVPYLLKLGAKHTGQSLSVVE